MSNNHPSRNKAAAVLKRHHEQYEQLETIAAWLSINDYIESAHTIRCAICDLKQARKELNLLEKAIDSMKKSKQS